MALFPVRSNPRWQPAVILENYSGIARFLRDSTAFLYTLLCHSHFYTQGNKAALVYIVSVFFSFGFLYSFYPRDAMLARVIAIATCPSVRLSVRPSEATTICRQIRRHCSPLQNKVWQSCLLSSRTRSVEPSPALRSVSRYCQTVQTITENSLLPVAFRSQLTVLLQFLTQHILLPL